MNKLRRMILKGTMAGGTLGVAVGAGLLTPTAVLAAAWPDKAFKAKQFSEALSELVGMADAAESAEIKVKAPDIAENGSVVPVKITTSLKDVESISILAPNNPTPLVASFTMGAGAHGFASTRIKMGKTGDVIAVVKAGGKLYSAKKEVKVTIGGCGG